MAEEVERIWGVWKILERSPLSPSILGLVWKGTTVGSSELHRLTDEASTMTMTLVTCKQMSWRVGGQSVYLRLGLCQAQRDSPLTWR